MNVSKNKCSIIFSYAAVIYDTNCIIYQCFKTTEESKQGTPVNISSPFTDITRKITNFIIKNNRTIHTLQIAMKEITRESLTRAVKERISNDTLRRSLGFNRGEEFPRIIYLKILKNLRKKVERLQYKSWFNIETGFQANRSDLKSVGKFFLSLSENPKYQMRFKPHKNPIPSEVDISLVLYSKQKQFALISNDKHITEFRNELESKNYTFKIIPLMELVNLS